MAIDIEKVVGAEMPPLAGSWSADDVILYHLGLGAGTRRPTRASSPTRSRAP